MPRTDYQATQTGSPRLLAPLALASASPRRAGILSDAGFRFDVSPANVNESAVAAETPEQMAVRLAETKAASVAARRPGDIVLGADTLVVLDGQALGKPSDEAEATDMLRRLRGRSHDVITGIAVAGACRPVSMAEVTRVVFRAYSDVEIQEYVSSGRPLDKAGAYGIQDEPFSPAASFTGCYLNVVGLPLCAVTRLLRQAGCTAEDDTLPECPGPGCAGADLMDTRAHTTTRTSR
ncbi:MAG: nucleoside triphosphate pyrophosphatase [Dehalococcoidia bacterium]